MIRVRGRLVPMEDFPVLDATMTRELIYGVLSNDQRQRLETDWQLDFAYSVPNTARFRVNAYFQRNAIGAAFRLIPSVITPIDTLGLPAVVHDFCNKPRGLVLVTGPTGSGKSTSLAAMIDEINSTREDHILTVEDPIEFLHGHKKSLDQPARDRLGRHELRRRPEGRAAPGPRRHPRRRDARPGDDLHRADRRGDRPPRLRHAAHAERAVDDRPRHRRLPAPPAAADPRAALHRLQGVMTQTLIPTADGAGRVVACETLVPTPAVRNLIREGKTHQIPSSMQTGSNVGMQTMDTALAALVRQGKISQRTAEGQSSTPDELKRLLGGMGGFGIAA
jgi:twitching motility protein PilT